MEIRKKLMLIGIKLSEWMWTRCCGAGNSTLDKHTRASCNHEAKKKIIRLIKLSKMKSGLINGITNHHIESLRSNQSNSVMIGWNVHTGRWIMRLAWNQFELVDKRRSINNHWFNEGTMPVSFRLNDRSSLEPGEELLDEWGGMRLSWAPAVTPN